MNRLYHGTFMAYTNSLFTPEPSGYRYQAETCREGRGLGQTQDWRDENASLTCIVADSHAYCIYEP